ncbi:hypothetical protein [Sphingomonas hengshuiensis]|nr:hypothetical protein [Sphingomonas hengshuiensis]
MTALLGRRLDIAEQDALLKFYAKVERRGGSLTPRETEVRRLLRRLQYNREYVGRYVTADECVEGLLALDAVERERPLTHAEAERRGALVAREQRWADKRPARIARLRAELALLEGLTIAERGAEAVPQDPEEIEMVETAAGHWSAPRQEAA